VAEVPHECAPGCDGRGYARTYDRGRHDHQPCEDGKDRKLCELVLAREDLLHILNRMPVTPLSPRDE
jgi:hypothetical protein